MYCVPLGPPIRGPEKPRTTLQVAGLLSKLLIAPLSDQLRALSRSEQHRQAAKVSNPVGSASMSEVAPQKN